MDHTSVCLEAHRTVASVVQKSRGHIIRMEITTGNNGTAQPSDTPQLQFYRRPLPVGCIDFASDNGKRIFSEALMNGHMNSFFKLCSQYRTQDEPAYCGLTSLVMALNVLEIDPGRIWKGPWRWYHENMLDCCTPLQVAREKGIDMDQFVCLARCNSLTVKVKFGSDIVSADELRNEIKAVTRKDDVVFVASYSRRTLGQTGDGHFSPIAGYHEQQDLVLILDTARFKYPPHWVPLPVLLDAMKTEDPETGRSRGYMLLSSDINQPSLLLFRPSCAFTVDAERGKHCPQLQNFTKEWKKWLISMIRLPSQHEDIVHDALAYILQLQSQSDYCISLFCFTLPSMRMSKLRYAIACPPPSQGLTKVTCVVKSLITELESLKIFSLVQRYIDTKTDEEKRIFLKLFQNADQCPESKCAPLTTSNYDFRSSFSLSEHEESPSSCTLCEGMIEIGPEHAATLFLLAWPHSSSLCTVNSSRRNVDSSLRKTLMESKHCHCQGLQVEQHTENMCQAGTVLVDSITDDLNKCDNQCIKGEINTIKFKFREVIKYHNISNTTE